MLRMAALAVFTIASAFAQNLPACDGDIAIIRVSTIKPGAMAKFMAAVAAHKAWYRNHGFKDNAIVASRVILTDPHQGTSKYSETEMVTYHVHPPNEAQAEAKKDAAWDAFVKQYRDTSAIKEEYVTCMPKLVP
jgi:hypothetical protein